MPFNFKRNIGNPPPTGNLPTFFAGSVFNSSLNTSVKNTKPNPIQPPSTGSLPEFYDGKGKPLPLDLIQTKLYKNSSK